MTLSEFKTSLNNPTSPQVTTLLKALWHDARGEWDKAHDLAQDVNTQDGSWIHAYLHRKEGDRSNAQYWYNRAQKDAGLFTGARVGRYCERAALNLNPTEQVKHSSSPP